MARLLCSNLRERSRRPQRKTLAQEVSSTRTGVCLGSGSENGKNLYGGLLHPCFWASAQETPAALRLASPGKRTRRTRRVRSMGFSAPGVLAADDWSVAHSREPTDIPRLLRPSTTAGLLERASRLQYRRLVLIQDFAKGWPMAEDPRRPQPAEDSDSSAPRTKMLETDLRAG
jgi:hypothetical protein